MDLYLFVKQEEIIVYHTLKIKLETKFIKRMIPLQSIVLIHKKYIECLEFKVLLSKTNKRHPNCALELATRKTQNLIKSSPR